MHISSWPALNPLLALQKESSCALPFPFNAPHKTYAYLARGLIYHLFRALELKEDEVVLVPDYHQGNEIRAIRAAGAKVRFYHIDRRMEPDLEELARLATPEVRAIFSIHYNGWPQPVQALSALCRERGIVLVEDCAMSMFAEVDARPLGTFGDYSIFCLYKSLPVPHGGLLVQNRNPIPALEDLELRLANRASVGGRALELMLEAVQTEVEWLGRGLFFVKHAVGDAMSLAHLKRAPVGDVGFDLVRANLGMAPMTRYLLERIDFDGIPELRRMLYSLLWTRLVGHVSLIDKELRPGVCPLFFPMLVRDKKLAVEALRQRGIGAVELWNHAHPEVDEASSPDATYLRRHAIELPIHQDMSPEQIDYIAGTVRELRPLLTLDEGTGPRQIAAGPRSADAPASAPAPALGGAPEMTAQTLRGSPAIVEAIAEEWSALCDEGPCDDLFYRPEWYLAYLRAFEADSTVLLVTARAEGKLRAVLPLIEDQGVLFGLPVRRLRCPANSHVSRADLIHGAFDGARAAGMIWAQVKSIPRWDVLEIQYVPEGGAAETMLHLAERENWPTGHWECSRSPYIRIADAGPGGTLGSTRAKFRANLRRRLRKLEAMGQVTLRHVPEADPELLQTFYDLEKAGWKGSEGSAIDCDPKTRAFYDALAQETARLGRLSIYVLEHEGRPIAMQYGFRSAKRYFIQKPAYDEAYSQYSPGHILMEKVLAELETQGVEELDFLGAWMPWKADWTSSSRAHSFCYVFHKGTYGSLLHAAKFWLVPFAKERILPHAPAKVVARLGSGGSRSH